MRKDDAAMDEALRAKTAALQANDDETGDGRIDLADLKHQLDRLEAQLALQDRQNRTLLRNQRLRMAVGGAVAGAGVRAGRGTVFLHAPGV